MSTTIEAPVAGLPLPVQHSPQTAWRNGLAGGVGTFLEWFDYGLFGTASALYLGPLFFTGDAFVATLSAFATFAVGFAVRPIGGIVLGNLGDIWGRKPVLVLTIVLMGSATFLMGLLPTHAQIGIWAPILLVFLRLVQGFGAGAEFAGSLAYVSESSPENRRGFLLSFTSAASAFGPFVGAGLFAILNGAIPHDGMVSWGWRIPFLASVLFVVIGLVVRSRLQDSDEYQAYVKAQKENKVQRPKVPIAEVYRHDPRAFWAALLAPAAIGYTNYLVSVFGVSYIVNTLKLSSQLSLTTLLFMTGVSTVTCIIAGWIADKLGAVKTMIVGAMLALAFSVPFFLLMNTRIPVLVVVGGVVGMVFIWSILAPAHGLLLPKLFDVQYRYSGLGLTREISTSVLGGTAPFLGTALVGLGGGQPWLVVLATSAAVLMSAAGAWLGSHRSS